jgi:hypothetical protein
MQPTVDTCKVKPLGVERGTPPFHHLPVVRMGRIPYSFQIVHVSGDTADIFRRAGPLPLQADGVRHIRAGPSGRDAARRSEQVIVYIKDLQNH